MLNCVYAAAPVRFRQRLVSTEVKERTAATFECSVSSKDVIPVWTVNGQVVKSNDRFVPVAIDEYV